MKSETVDEERPGNRGSFTDLSVYPLTLIHMKREIVVLPPAGGQEAFVILGTCTPYPSED